jgi:hypothetical protein
MGLLYDLSTKYKTLSIVGMSKNAGKTTALNYLIEEADDEGLLLGITSTGRDGETSDLVTGTEKPKVYLYEDTIVSVPTQLFEFAEGGLEILEKTGIDLAGESKGVFFDKALVTDTDKWGTASLTSGSFGQTFKITPLQLVRAISSVVNGGNLMEPYIVSEIVDTEGNTVLKQEPTAVRTTIRPETSEAMRTLIRSVVTEGTAKNAAVAGFSVGIFKPFIKFGIVKGG